MNTLLNIEYFTLLLFQLKMSQEKVVQIAIDEKKHVSQKEIDEIKNASQKEIDEIRKYKEINKIKIEKLSQKEIDEKVKEFFVPGLVKSLNLTAKIHFDRYDGRVDMFNIQEAFDKFYAEHIGKPIKYVTFRKYAIKYCIRKPTRKELEEHEREIRGDDYHEVEEDTYESRQFSDYRSCPDDLYQ